MSNATFQELRQAFKLNINEMCRIARERHYAAASRASDAEYEKDCAIKDGSDTEEINALILKHNQEVSKAHSCYYQKRICEEFSETLMYQEGYCDLTVARDNVKRVSFPSKPSDAFNFDRRKMCKFSRYLQLRGMDEKKEKVLSEFYGLALAQNASYSHTIYRGIDVHFAYGTQQTCMSGQCDALLLYEKNPEKVGVLVVNSSKGEDVSRCLIWYTEEGQTVLDRVYPNDAPSIPYINELCSKEGWSHRRDNSVHGNHMQEAFNCLNQYSVILKYEDSFPYLDSFRFGARRWIDGKEMLELVTNDSPRLRDESLYWARYESTENEDPHRTLGICDRCDGYTMEDFMGRMATGEMWCRRCRLNESVYIRETSEHYERSLCVFSEYHDRYILREMATFCEELDSWFLAREKVTLYNELGDIIGVAPSSHVKVVRTIDGVCTWRELVVAVDVEEIYEVAYVFKGDEVITLWGKCAKQHAVTLDCGIKCPYWYARSVGAEEPYYFDIGPINHCGLGDDWCMERLFGM